MTDELEKSLEASVRAAKSAVDRKLDSTYASLPPAARAFVDEHNIEVVTPKILRLEKTLTGSQARLDGTRGED